MPKFLEAKLKKEYGAKSKVPYMIMNKMGVMLGNKETSKGVTMDKKHSKHSKHSEASRKAFKKMRKGRTK